MKSPAEMTELLERAAPRIAEELDLGSLQRRVFRRQRRRRLSLLGGITVVVAMIATGGILVLDGREMNETVSTGPPEDAGEVTADRPDPTGVVFLERTMTLEPDGLNWDSNLVDMSLSGGSRSQIDWPEDWEDPASYRDVSRPVMSPDGRSLYFDTACFTEIIGCHGSELVIVRFDLASGSSEIVVNNGSIPALSPDGRWLASARADADDEITALGTLVIHDLQTGNEVSHELLDRDLSEEPYSYIERIAWSGSGDEIAVSIHEEDASTPYSGPSYDVVQLSWVDESLSETASYPLPEGVFWQGYMGTSFVGVCQCENNEDAADIVRLNATTGEIEETLFAVEGTHSDPHLGPDVRVETDPSDERLLVSVDLAIPPSELVSFGDISLYVWTREDPDPEPLVEGVRAWQATWSCVS